MLDQLLNLAKNHLADQFFADPDVDNQIAEQSANVAGDSIINSIMDMAKGGQLNGILNMLSGNQTSSNSPIVNMIMPGVVNTLAQKLGVNPNIAQMLASKAVPLVMNMLNGKVNRAEHNSGMDIAGLITNMLGGKPNQPNMPKITDVNVDTADSNDSGMTDLLGGLLNTFLGGQQNQQQQQQSNPQLDKISGLLKDVIGFNK